VPSWRVEVGNLPVNPFSRKVRGGDDKPRSPYESLTRSAVWPPNAWIVRLTVPGDVVNFRWMLRPARNSSAEGRHSALVQRSLAYSALACLRTGMSSSASFQRARKSS
jgi:hypothetical protein